MKKINIFCLTIILFTFFCHYSYAEKGKIRYARISIEKLTDNEKDYIQNKFEKAKKRGRPVELNFYGEEDGLKFALNFQDQIQKVSLNAYKLKNIDKLKQFKNLHSLTIDNIKDDMDISSISSFTSLKYLFIKGGKYKNLFFLSKLINLESLHIYMPPKNLNDISFLKSMTNLNNLTLENIKISDITILSKLTKLKTLSLRMTEVADLKPIMNHDLIKLDLYATPVKDLTPIKNFKNLKDLNLYMVKADNYKALHSLTKIKKLTTFYSNVKDISFLENMKELENFSAQYNQIDNWEPIKNCKNLKILEAGYSNFSDCKLLENMPLLESVYLENCKIKNAKSLTKNTQLNTLNIKNVSGITDFNFLLGINNLRVLGCDKKKLGEELISKLRTKCKNIFIF